MRVCRTWFCEIMSQERSPYMRRGGYDDIREEIGDGSSMLRKRQVRNGSINCGAVATPVMCHIIQTVTHRH